MLLACSWSVLSFGPWACWPFASTQGRIRCPTLAPRAPSRDRGQKGKGLQLSRAAAQAITVVILWLTQHFGANPPTSRKCYRSTATIRMILSMLLVSFFLPGSRAEVVSTNDEAHSGGSQLAEAATYSEVANGSQSAEVGYTNVMQSLFRSNLLWILGGLILMTVIWHMMPGLGGGSRTENFNYRIPPSWSPENDSNYSFRAYMTDISLWVMLTDMAPHQQCAAIIMRLGGQARELARTISPQEIVAGGMRDGQLLAPVTYLLGALQSRFANLEEETRLQSMTEMLAFARRSGESINAMLARYEVVRQRAANEGHFVMSIEGCALQILRAAGIHASQLTTLLHQFGGRLPVNENEYQAMITQVRRQ